MLDSLQVHQPTISQFTKYFDHSFRSFAKYRFADQALRSYITNYLSDIA
jgi:hypothetical protein